MGILALANMVPQTEPDSQWTAVNFASTRRYVCFVFEHLGLKCLPNWSTLVFNALLDV